LKFLGIWLCAQRYVKKKYPANNGDEKSILSTRLWLKVREFFL